MPYGTQFYWTVRNEGDEAEDINDLGHKGGTGPTPQEIVIYMVGRVDRTLREQFSLPAGLADPSIIVLDPCCGTGAYLVEAVRTIHRYHAEEQSLGDLAAFEAKKAVQTRVFGFELLPAPYVISHLQALNAQLQWVFLLYPTLGAESRDSL